MKKYFALFAIVMYSSFGFAQDFDVTNNSPKNIVCNVFAYGSNPGYNTCSQLIHASFTVNSLTVESFNTFNTSWTWRDTGENIVPSGSLANWGTPVWHLVEYTYQCGAGFPPPRVGAKVNNGLCNVAQWSYSGSGCNISASWTPQTGGGVLVVFN